MRRGLRPRSPCSGDCLAAASFNIAAKTARLESDTAKSLFVPPIVVPAFLMVLIMARAYTTKSPITTTIVAGAVGIALPFTWLGGFLGFAWD